MAHSGTSRWHIRAHSGTCARAERDRRGFVFPNREMRLHSGASGCISGPRVSVSATAALRPERERATRHAMNHHRAAIRTDGGRPGSSSIANRCERGQGESGVRRISELLKCKCEFRRTAPPGTPGFVALGQSRSSRQRLQQLLRFSSGGICGVLVEDRLQARPRLGIRLRGDVTLGEV
jgi:hypothetical protein